MIDHSRKEFRDRPLDVICKKTQSRGHSRSLKFKNFNDCSYSAVDIIYKPRDHKNIATSKTFHFLIGKENCYRYHRHHSPKTGQESMRKVTPDIA